MVVTSLFILRESDGASQALWARPGKLRSINMDLQAQEEGRCSLAAEALRSWGRLRLRARGLSMLPTLWPGDFLTVQSRSAEQIEPGEIILYMREGRFFVHRVKSKSVAGDEIFLIVRGDCMPDDDPPVRSSEVLGKIVGVQRAGSSFCSRAQALAVSQDGGVHVLPLESVPANRAANLDTAPTRRRADSDRVR